MTLQSQGDRAALSQVIDKALLVQAIHRGPYRQGMAIRAEVDALDWEGCQNLLDDDLLMDIIEDYLTVQTDRAHEQLVQRAEAQTFYKS